MLVGKCGCGLPVKYSMLDGGGSCNKYSVCLSYDELLEVNNKLTNQLRVYQGSVNKLDDYFEYANESKVDRKKVHQILGNLTDGLVELNKER